MYKLICNQYVIINEVNRIMNQNALKSKGIMKTLFHWQNFFKNRSYQINNYYMPYNCKHRFSKTLDKRCTNFYDVK